MKQPMRSPILDAAARLMAPHILLFALYVLFHGHYSPGGGFQAGTILAAAVILVHLVRGPKPGWGINRRQAAILGAAGVLIYAGTGFLTMALGGNFLDYSFLPLPLDAPHRRSMGILLVETGVTAAVMGTMILIYECLTGAGLEEE